MSRKLLYQQVFAPAIFTGSALSQVLSMNTDGTVTNLATNPVLGVVNFATAAPKAALLNCDPYVGIQMAVSSQAQTTLSGTIYLYGVYPNGIAPAGAGESAYSNPSFALSSAINNFLVTMSLYGSDNLQSQGGTISASTVFAQPQWLFPAFYLTVAATVSSPMTISIWGIQQGVNYI
jgi:hypothetical protein